MSKNLPRQAVSYLVIFSFLLASALTHGQIRPPASNIVTQPKNVSACAPTATVTFKIGMAKNLNGYLYQWQMAPYKTTDFKPVSEVTKDSVDDSKASLVLEFSKISKLGALTKIWDRMQFRCVVAENIKLATPEVSSVAYLYVHFAPTITKHPEGADKLAGESHSFSISASGSTPRTYQWQKDGADIGGATSSVYTIASLVTGDAGTYRCIVTNSCGSRTSTGAVLTVTETFYEAWVKQTSNTLNDIRKVSFTSIANGWAAVSDQDKLLHTTNGGEDWTPTSTGLGSYTWHAIAFPTANLGFVGTYGNIGRTENGGTSWERYSFRDTLGLSSFPYVYDFFFLDASTGWAVGADGLILKTSDGGDSWVKQNFSGDPLFVLDVNLYSVYFMDASDGWVVGDNGAIFHTYDGGAAWDLQATPNTTPLYDVAFTDAGNGFAVGTGYRNLLVTSNGGTDWNLIPALDFPYMVPYSIHFEGSQDGWAAGYKWVSGSIQGSIARTNDGGATWHEQYIEEGDMLQHMDFADQENGWAVGSSGTMLRTGTGGCFIPTVNLYGDEALCASESFTMRADTFAKNLNCSYLWSTGATTGALTVYDSDEYSVTVTSLCGETAGDSKVLEFYPLPPANAGLDTSMCYGDTLQLNASGGIQFEWTPAGTLTDPSIQNPRAYPLSTTQYYVSVTDTNGCTNVDDLTLTVHPIPASTFSAPEFVCGTGQAGISYTGSAGGEATYSWDFDGGSDTPEGEIHQVSWSEIGMKTVSLVVEENLCVSDTTFHDISVNPVPVSDFDLQAAVCGSSQAEITYSGTDSVGADYVWDFDGGSIVSGEDEGPYMVSWATEGTKSVSLQVTQDGCESDQTVKQTVVAYPYNEQVICLVTVDLETGKNAIIWEKGDHPGVEFYRIYRESATGGGIYDPIATLPADTLSYWIDETSEPQSKSHKYRISVIDTCGNESDASLYHKSMLLTTNLGTDRINVTWTEYEIESTGFGFQYYIIYRGSSPADLDSLNTIPADNTLYPDIDPPAGNNYYQVAGVIADPCSPTGNFKSGTGPYNHSLSNLDDNKLQSTSIGKIVIDANKLRVFPNPFQDQVRVEYQLQTTSDVKIEVYNILGVSVLELNNVGQGAGLHQADIRTEDLDGSSIYYLRFSVGNHSAVKKLIPAR